MKNLRKRINVRLANKAEDFQHTLLIKFFEDYAAIHEMRPVIILNKPIYV